VGHERVELDERPCVEQQVESLARGQLAAGVLLVDARLAAAQSRFGTHRTQSLDLPGVARHGPPSRARPGRTTAES